MKTACQILGIALQISSFIATTYDLSLAFILLNLALVFWLLPYAKVELK